MENKLKELSDILVNYSVHLEKGEKVQLIGFGTFEVRERAAREGRNPKTNETIHIPASKVPAFKAGHEFKKLVNK